MTDLPARLHAAGYPRLAVELDGLAMGGAALFEAPTRAWLEQVVTALEATAGACRVAELLLATAEATGEIDEAAGLEVLERVRAAVRER